MRFPEKVAVVTGATSEIGVAVTRGLQAGGAHVLAVDSDAEALAALAAEAADGDPTVETAVADITLAGSVAAYAEQAQRRFGGIDLFFNHADVEGPAHLLPDYPETAFDHVIDTNLKAVFLGLKYVLPLVRDGGAVVNTASDLAVVGAAGLSAYVASKHGVLGLTKAAALECERRSIRVNAVCPIRRRTNGRDTIPGVPFGDVFEPETDTAEDVANLVLFLLCDGGPAHHRSDGIVEVAG